MDGVLEHLRNTAGAPQHGRKVVFLVVFLGLIWPAVSAAAPTSPNIQGNHSPPASDTAATAPPLLVAFFYSPTCYRCDEAEEALVKAEKKWASRVKIEKLNV